MGNQPMQDLLWHCRFRWKLPLEQVTGDTRYGTTDHIVAIEKAGLLAYVPLTDFDKRSPLFGKQRFRYDAEGDVYLCPGGAVLPRQKIKYTERVIVYRAEAEICNTCPLKAKCTESENGRSIARSFDEEYLEWVRGYHETEAYKKALRKRKVWVEPLFGEGKQWHGMERFRLRRLEKVNIEALVTASGQNLKRLLSWRGWAGAGGLVERPE